MLILRIYSAFYHSTFISNIMVCLINTPQIIRCEVKFAPSIGYSYVGCVNDIIADLPKFSLSYCFDRLSMIRFGSICFLAIS